jgi:hypothetical protein
MLSFTTATHLLTFALLFNKINTIDYKYKNQ